MARRVCLSLLHFPVVDRGGEIITTAITNLDVHDISRSARTFGLSDVFIVHPVEAQRTLASRVKEHWVNGAGGKRIPDRSAALDRVRVVSSLDEAIAAVSPDVELWTTAAQSQGKDSTFAELRVELGREGPPVMLLFGTGWGIAPEVFRRATRFIEPIRGAGDWNHLSVRGACAIALDRLIGDR